MKLKTAVFIALLGTMGLSLPSCTGFSIASYYGPPITPTPEYGVLSYEVGLKGGGIIHMNTVPGTVGTASAGKVGTACQASYLGLVSLGDSSISAAKADGGISNVASIDYEQFAVLAVLYHRVCTTVQGE